MEILLESPHSSQALNHYRVVTFPSDTGTILVPEALELVRGTAFHRLRELAASRVDSHGLFNAA